MTADHTKPFNRHSALAGDMFECRDGQSVEMLVWDLVGRKPLLGLVGDQQRPVTWTEGGKFTLYRDDALDLVMVEPGAPA